jgi:hydrogenase nickel incorporation protein HypA/HybF
VHEYSIVQALVERVEAEAAARRAIAVHRLALRIGRASGVEVELLRTAYYTFRARTICDRAELDVEEVDPVWECPRCGAVVAAGSLLRCASCGAPARLRQGDEIVLDRIEMEVA